MKRLRVLVMASRVNYVPGNNGALLARLLEAGPDHEVAGVLFHDNRTLATLRTALALVCSGAVVRVGSHLLRNWLRPDPKARLARRHALPVRKAADVHAGGILHWVRALHIDLLLHLRTRVILRSELLALPRLGAVNLHHGTLPAHRGTLCDLWQLVHCEPGGFTLHRMVAAVDRGAILDRREVASAAGCGKNYARYLRLSERAEGDAILALFARIARDGCLPQALPGDGETASAWHRTPGIAGLREYRKQGWKL